MIWETDADTEKGMAFGMLFLVRNL